LLLGSNDFPRQHLSEAVQLLREHFQVVAVSSVYESAAQGMSNAPNYWNMAVKLLTSLSPTALKTDVLRPIEAQLGRKREAGVKSLLVAIDLDIALWGDAVMEYGDKRVPHPDIRRFAYAALPLAELAPDYVHPETKQTLAEMAAGFDSSGIRNLGQLSLD